MEIFLVLFGLTWFFFCISVMGFLVKPDLLFTLLTIFLIALIAVLFIKILTIHNEKYEVPKQELAAENPQDINIMLKGGKDSLSLRFNNVSKMVPYEIVLGDNNKYKITFYGTPIFDSCDFIRNGEIEKAVIYEIYEK